MQTTITIGRQRIHGQIQTLTSQQIMMPMATSPTSAVWDFLTRRRGSTWIDVVALTYNGNQLKGVVDKENDFTYMATKNFIQFGDGESDYSYNANGALQTDANKGIVFIDYDTYGYVSAIYFRNGSIIRYVHAPDGSKLQTSYTSAVSHLVMPYGEPFVLAPSQIQSVTTRDYWGR